MLWSHKESMIYRNYMIVRLAYFPDNENWNSRGLAQHHWFFIESLDFSTKIVCLFNAFPPLTSQLTWHHGPFKKKVQCWCFCKAQKPGPPSQPSLWSVHILLQRTGSGLIFSSESTFWGGKGGFEEESSCTWWSRAISRHITLAWRGRYMVGHVRRRWRLSLNPNQNMSLARAFPNPQVGGGGEFSPDFVLKGLDARMGVGAGAPGWESFQELPTISKASPTLC